MIFLRVYLFTLICTLISAPVYAEALFDKANETFSKGNYHQAIKLYEQIEKKKGHSASLYFNIANSYAQLGEDGKAVLHYERALRLAPNNPDILENLSYFKKETGLFLDEQPTFAKLLNLFTPNKWSSFALFFLIATTCIVIFWKKVFQENLPRGFVCLTFLLLLTTACVLAAAQTYMSAPSHVVINDVKLLVSPFESSDSKGVIKSGRSAFPGKEYKNYVHIEDETGQAGWIKKSSIEAVLQ